MNQDFVKKLVKNPAVKPVVIVFKIDFLEKDSYDFFKNTRFGLWEVSPKTPHTQFLCRVQFYKLPLKSNREHSPGSQQREFIKLNSTQKLSMRVLGETFHIPKRVFLKKS
jgi:hypothetical protein